MPEKGRGSVLVATAAFLVGFLCGPPSMRIDTVALATVPWFYL